MGKRTSTNPAEVREHYKFLRTKDVRLFGSVLAIRITFKFLRFIHETFQSSRFSCAEVPFPILPTANFNKIIDLRQDLPWKQSTAWACNDAEFEPSSLLSLPS